MEIDALMYLATTLHLLCFLIKLRTNQCTYDIPIKVGVWIASTLALSYSIVNGSAPFIVNYTIVFFINTYSLSIKLYIAYQNRYQTLKDQNESKTPEIEMTKFLSETSDNVEQIMEMFTIDIETKKSDLIVECPTSR
uniref:Uncharacterized protein n=1 Tax=viral metagenome TaxID=1070528 RepID=A0A6C0DQW0_9ZZZZ